MPKKYEMDKEVYIEREFYYRHELHDPLDFSELFENLTGDDKDSDEETKEKRVILKEKLVAIVRKHIKNSLTKRQQDAINLYLMGKNQETSAVILGISQEGLSSRLKIGLTRLKKICLNDEAIKALLKDIRNP